MKVTSSTFTIAEYCKQFREHSIKINLEYQRTDKVWPPAARSFLIDTILLGYPMPKFSLYQKTDLKTRETIKEIVDGQQRSRAIVDFYEDKFKISGKSIYAGRSYQQLEDADQQKFVDYAITVDIFVGATEIDIRQVFRRMNSYTIPLNPQEKRHATHQGDLKWHIYEMTTSYSEALKSMGVLTENRLSRMADAALFSEICLALNAGIDSASERQLDKFYEDNDVMYSARDSVAHRFEQCFSILISWRDIHNTPIMKPYNFYSLFLALAHVLDPSPGFQDLFNVTGSVRLADHDAILSNLTTLGEVLEQDSAPNPKYADFLEACAKGTNRLSQRQTRFKWFCKALTETSI